MDLDGILLPYQQKWLADESRVKIWEKSRRIGATWCEAADAVFTAGRKHRSSDYYYTSVNEKLTREFIRDAGEWARQFNFAIEQAGDVLLKQGDRSIKVQQIQFANGKKIMGIPSNPSVLRGRQGYLCCDEVAFIENPDALLKAGLAFLMWGGKVRILSTHNGEDNPFNEIIKETLAGKKPYSLHRTTLDDALEQGLYKRICVVTNEEHDSAKEAKWRQDLVDFYGDHADEELFCVPTNSSGGYFSRVMLENCMTQEIPVINLTLKDSFLELSELQRRKEINDWLIENLSLPLSKLHKHRKSSFGFDFGRSGDLSYLVPLQEMPNLVRKPPFTLEMRNVPYEQQRQVLFYIIQRLPRFQSGILDATGNGAALAEAIASRFGKNRIEELKLTQDWYRENMPRYKAALEDKKILLPADSNIIDDHNLIQVVKGIAKPVEKRKITGVRTNKEQRHCDSAIALCLAWSASCKDKIVTSPAMGSFSFSEYDTWS